MVELNTQNKLPKKVKWYVLTKIVLFLFLISFLISLPLSLLSKHGFSYIFWFLAIFVGLPSFIYLFIYYGLLNFVVENDKITINSGIIIKHSKSIPFDRVQSVNNVRGILTRIFGLTRVSIWTSSPEQIRIHEKESTHRPDGRLELNNYDAEWLKNFILDKRS